MMYSKRLKQLRLTQVMMANSGETLCTVLLNSSRIAVINQTRVYLVREAVQSSVVFLQDTPADCVLTGHISYSL